MSKRVLKDKSIEVLENFFRVDGRNRETLRMLEFELTFRTTARSQALLRQVQESLARAVDAGGRAGGDVPTVGPTRPATDVVPPSGTRALPEPQPVGGLEPPAKPDPMPDHAPTPTGMASIQGEDEEFVPPAAADISVEEACRVLGVDTGASWAHIEARRCECVRLSSPEITAELPREKVDVLREDARRVNGAYLLLARWRCAGAGDQESTVPVPSNAGQVRA